MNITAAILLLIVISIYDHIAVNKIKHMTHLAKFQMKSQLFAGIFIPYKKHKGEKLRPAKEGEKGHANAILGGGDIAFPLLFAAVAMKSYGLFPVMIISLTSAAALMFLFYKSQAGKFYPAMPIISLGVFVGYAILGLWMGFVF